MNPAELEIWKMWRIHKTIKEMCYDRGYMIQPYEPDLTLEQFKEKYGNDSMNLNMIAVHDDDDSNQLLILFPENSKISVKEIQQYKQHMEEEQVYNAIIVVQNGITAMCQQFISQLDSKFNYEIFLRSELIMNVTKHELVPKHVPMTEAEKQNLLKSYKITEDQLMSIQVNDPVARYFGMKVGQMMKIIRKSETGGCYVNYRLVIDMDN